MVIGVLCKFYFFDFFDIGFSSSGLRYRLLYKRLYFALVEITVRIGQEFIYKFPRILSVGVQAFIELGSRNVSPLGIGYASLQSVGPHRFGIVRLQGFQSVFIEQFLGA